MPEKFLKMLMENWRIMNIEKLINIIGVLGVIGSLIFVGLQMQQSHEIALAGQQQERASEEMQNFRSFLEAGYDLDFIARQEGNIFEEMTSEESIARRSFGQIYWYVAENDFIQYQNDLMSDEVFEAKKRNVEYLLGLCDLRDIFEWRRTFFSDDFLELVSSFDNPCD